MEHSPKVAYPGASPWGHMSNMRGARVKNDPDVEAAVLKLASIHCQICGKREEDFNIPEPAIYRYVGGDTKSPIRCYQCWMIPDATFNRRAVAAAWEVWKDGRWKRYA